MQPRQEKWVLECHQRSLQVQGVAGNVHRIPTRRPMRANTRRVAREWWWFDAKRLGLAPTFVGYDAAIVLSRWLLFTAEA